MIKSTKKNWEAQAVMWGKTEYNTGQKEEEHLEKIEVYGRILLECI